MTPLHAALDAQPFGDPKQIGLPDANNAAGGQLISWLDQLAAQLERRTYDRATTRQLVLTWCRQATSTPSVVHDFASARQLVWAVQAVLSDHDEIRTNATAQALLKQLAEQLRVEIPLSHAAVFEAAANYDPELFRQRLDAFCRSID